MSSYTPAMARFTIVVDGLVYTPDLSIYWETNRQIVMVTDGTPAYPSTVTVSYDGSDPLFANSADKPVGQFTNYALTPL